MKKTFILLALTVFSIQLFSQKDNSRYYNSWRLGLNIGGSWQTADYKSKYGGAGGLTLEKGFHENATNIFSFAIRGRYLGANTYGMDYNRNYDVRFNPAYNGTYDPKVSYLADTTRKARGYVYDNYKMTLGEGSLELQLSFNRLRERTHVLLNLWGGVGITSFRTKSDLLDADGKIYDFNMVDSTGNKTSTINTYNALIDKKYESYAYGSKNGNLITFSPSAGIGLGYQFTPGFSLIWEYKVTFPQGSNADLLDGRYGNNKDMIAGNNDYYHYTGLNLLFTLRGKHKNKSVNNETVYTNTTVPTNSLVAPPTNSIVPTNTTSVILPPKGPNPIIKFITPPSNGYTVNNALYKISAEILNIEAVNQLTFKFNGTTISNFTFNIQTKIVEFNATLLKGSNSIQIIAKNANGTDDKLIYMFYEQPKQGGLPPVVSIINPAVCPLTSTSQSYTVTAVITNVTSKNNLVVKLNNVEVSNYNFNQTTGQIDLPINLVSGNNDINIKASNNFGSDTKACTVTFAKRVQNVKAPVVTIVDPAQSGSISSVNSYVVKAQVFNVPYSENITTTFNNQSIAFTFDANTNMVSIPISLKTGSNVVSVQASNIAGADTKTTSLTYIEKKSGGRPPVLNYINPAQAIYTTSVQNNSFKLSVLNIGGNNDIAVTINGSSFTAFSYDVNTKELQFTSNLILGNNNIIVKATNTYGNDVKTINVNYIQKIEAAKKPPVVIITNPINNMQTANTAVYEFKASVTNVPNTQGLIVKFNGTSVTNYTFDGVNISYTGSLISGNNSFEVKATNNDGSDVKNSSINYFKKVKSPPPVVNLINPATPDNASDAGYYIFKLAVLNVNSNADINVLHNGVPVSNFTYNSTTKEVDFSLNLVQGQNAISVKGTNAFGSDSKTITINYTPKAVVKNTPVITIQAPQNSPATEINPVYLFKASITNIPNKAGLVVKHNGNILIRYSYDGANLSYNATLQSGNNTFEITATNTDGSDAKAAVVNYKPKIINTPPVVNLINPASQENASDAGYYIFKLSVLNVNSNADINVLHNGASINNFTYNTTTKEVNFSLNLTQGQNTIVVKGTNSAGSDSKQININYKPHVELKTPPVVAFVNPVNGSANVQTPSYTFKANVSNVANISGLVVKYNGTSVTNYTYNGSDLLFSTNLQLGDNTLEITATNNDGSDTKSALVNYKQRIVPKPPVVVILTPVNTPTVETASYNFTFKAYNVTQTQLEVKLNGQIISAFNFANNNGSFTNNLIDGANALSIKATNADGSVTKTASVVFKPKVTTTPADTTTHQADGGRMVKICHIPPGNEQNPQTIIIPISAWPTHAAHGDLPKECPNKPTNIIVNPGRPKGKIELEKNDSIQNNLENNNQLIRPR